MKGSLYHMSYRRSKLEIYLDVLSSIHEGISKPTRIMYSANLSWKALNKILDEAWHDRWWAIRVHEEPPHPAELELHKSYPYSMVSSPTYRIYIDIKEIPTRHFELPELLPDYDTWTNKRLLSSATAELKYRIKRKIKSWL